MRSTPFSTRRGCFWALVLMASAGVDAQLSQQPASGQAIQEIVADGVPFERELAGGQTHTYQLPLGNAQCVRVAVAQLGVDVTIVIRDASGRTQLEESRLGERGTDLGLWSSPGPGAYELIIDARQRQAAGRYRLLVALLPADERCKAAYENQNQGWRFAQPNRAGYSPAYAGVFYTETDRLKQALTAFEAALPYWQSIGDAELTAATLFEMGRLNFKLKKMDLALAQLKESAALFHASGQRAEEGIALDQIGVVHAGQGDYAKAGPSFAAAVALMDALPRNEAATLMLNHAVGLQNLSRSREALAFFERARDAFRALGKTDLELQALSEIGRTHYATGEMVKALALANEGLTASRTHRMPLLQARFAQDIARVYLYLDDYDLARDYCQRSIALFQGERYINGEVATLLLLGDAQYGLGDLRAAQASYERAAALARGNTFKEAEARAATKLGSVFALLGDHARAIEIRQDALAYYRGTGNLRSEATTLLALGKTYRLMGNPQEAASTLERGLRISRESLGGYAETQFLGELAIVARDAGRLDDARRDLTALLRIFDAERRSLLAPGLSVTFVSGAQNWYEVYADLLMRQHEADARAGHAAQAWSAAEHAKSWGLLEMLAQGRTDVDRGVDRALLEKRRALWTQMSARAAEVARSPNPPPAGAHAIDDLGAQLQLAEAHIRASAPRYVELVEPQPVTPDYVQRELLDPDTVLLEFSLGDPHGWLWSVTSDGFDSFKLGARTEIDAAARRLYELLTARQSRLAAGAPSPPVRIASSDAELPAAAKRLGAMLLGPIEARLRGEWRGKRLAVVASGALEYVPFSVLALSDGRPLLVDHEIVTLPSATVLAALRRQRDGRTRASRTVAVIGDPVFDPQDPRLQRRTSRAAAATTAPDAASAPPPGSESTGNELRRAATAFTRSGFTRLPFSRQEVSSIAALAPPATVLEAVDFRASHSLAVSGELRQFRIVHFATHGLLNSQHPELSGLVLSLVDEKGRPQNGFLRLQDIYNLKLSADLVVLSACETALGREIKGEGLVGLTRGFMYAGTERVVASLWQVDDLATAELMKAFYRGMLQRSLSPAAALRAAQLHIRSQQRWASPYYWAAFTLQGEWR